MCSKKSYYLRKVFWCGNVAVSALSCAKQVRLNPTHSGLEKLVALAQEHLVTSRTAPGTCKKGSTFWVNLVILCYITNGKKALLWKGGVGTILAHEYGTGVVLPYGNCKHPPPPMSNFIPHPTCPPAQYRPCCMKGLIFSNFNVLCHWSTNE